MSQEILRLSEVYYMSLDCARSLSCCILMRYGEWTELAKLKARPSDYANASDYFKAAAASDFLRKLPNLPVTVDAEAATRASWFKSEEECRTANIYLQTRELLSDELNLLLDVATDFFCDVLGPCPLDLTPSFGPGATVSDLSRATTVLDKCSSKPSLTESAACLLPLWEETAWARAHLDRDAYKHPDLKPVIVEGNHFFTVPKTALIKRGCAKGPSVNVAYQLAVGKVIRGRLKKRIGLDLATRQELHVQLAKAGSMWGHLATLDSERASDTLSYRLVERLCSKNPLWFELLRTLREPKTLIQEAWIDLEKFSAMGNGYTFELETLVFLSLAYAVAWAHSLGHGTEGKPDESSAHLFGLIDPMDLVRAGFISVYGDDVIVPSTIARDVAHLLQRVGFTVNLEKSYFEGEFRESCGGDFFRGVSVSTPKLEKDPEQPADWFPIHNLLKKRLPPEVAEMPLKVIRSFLPTQMRTMFGPEWLGDIVLHGWYGPQVKARARDVFEIEGPIRPGETRIVTDPNQWVGTLSCLAPRIVRAPLSQYSPGAQLAYLLYTSSSSAPARRPIQKITYKVERYEGDYHIIFEDVKPRYPKWLADSPFSRYFGLE